MEQSYEMIFKRKSFRRFDDTLFISDNELNEITKEICNLKPLNKDIRTEFLIVDKSKTTCKRGQYCLLMYSEKKEHYLLNAGYTVLTLVDIAAPTRRALSAPLYILAGNIVSETEPGHF